MKKSFLTLLILTFSTISAIAQGCPSPSSATASVTFKRRVPGTLTGNFTINASGDKVAFAQGNLQYRATADGTGTDLEHNVAGGGTAQGIWRFAEHQYDFVGNGTYGNVYVKINGEDVKCDNTQISSTYTGWIDMFGFATSGYNNKHPYMSSENNSDYEGNSSRPCGMNGTNYDWGVYNAISNGGELGSWRTLTQAEWQYIVGYYQSPKNSDVSRRENADNLRTLAKVNGVDGLIIMPDGWTEDDVHLEITMDDFTSNVINTSNWDKLEKQGCVFLPKFGQRNGTTANGGAATYWASEWINSSGTSGNAPDFVFWDTQLYIVAGGMYKRCGCLVRLVKDVE